MKVLIATSMYPSPERPAFGTFVRTQVESLLGIGVDAEPFVLDGPNRKLMYPQAVVRLRRRLATGGVDLVHAHYSYVGAVARTQRRVPVVLTFHGDDLLGTVGEDGRTTTLSKAVALGGRLLARFVDGVIVQNEAMAALLDGHPCVHVIPHEVDLELFAETDREEARALLGLDPDRKYLLFSASPDIHVKRYPLARAATDVLQEHEPDVELLVVSRETQDRLALYMSASDALVFPSYQEGSPNIVKQAMACNLPIVATDVGDVADVIGTTRWCFLCEPTPTAFADRLREILAHRPRTSGRDAVRHLAGPLVAREVASVYEQVVASTRTRSARLRRAEA